MSSHSILPRLVLLLRPLVLHVSVASLFVACHILGSIVVPHLHVVEHGHSWLGMSDLILQHPIL